MVTRKRLAALFALLLVGGCTFQLIREIRGPDPQTAFRWVYRESPPDYIASLNSTYFSHLKGHSIYITFVCPKEKLDQYVDQSRSLPMYDQDVDYLRPWREENRFRELVPSGFPDLKECSFNSETKIGEMWETVYNPNSGHVFCWYVSDADIEPMK